MRKLCSLFVALLATIALEAADFHVDGISYNFLNDSNVAVTYLGRWAGDSYAYTGEIIIPSTVIHNNTSYNVTSIGVEAFKSCSSLTSVTIGNNVTSIGDYAFYGCSSLTSIIIPDNVVSIGYRAFEGCSFISVTIGDNVKSIGDWAFHSCSS